MMGGVLLLLEFLRPLVDACCKLCGLLFKVLVCTLVLPVWGRGNGGEDDEMGKGAQERRLLSRQDSACDHVCVCEEEYVSCVRRILRNKEGHPIMQKKQEGALVLGEISFSPPETSSTQACSACVSVGVVSSVCCVCCTSSPPPFMHPPPHDKSQHPPCRGHLTLVSWSFFFGTHTHTNKK